MKATATKPKAVAASTTIATRRRAPVRVIAYHPAASATTISGINTASRRTSASVLAIVATTTTAARTMAPRAASRCDIRGRVFVEVTAIRRVSEASRCLLIAPNDYLCEVEVHEPLAADVLLGGAALFVSVAIANWRQPSTINSRLDQWVAKLFATSGPADLGGMAIVLVRVLQGL